MSTVWPDTMRSGATSDRVHAGRYERAEVYGVRGATIMRTACGLTVGLRPAYGDSTTCRTCLAKVARDG